ncbi:MAG: formylglycine-generating enzyme family protein, partial [Coleofasciculaceae cyanobacterium SM2_3_26]|nr:formylglycine-generating enzyme family protein [Coleofasciculaceae cyanobacterium SM2_3_26]
TFSANNLGLHDMHGNVWEWCADHWHKNYEGAPIDGSIWLSSTESSGIIIGRIVRGGGWLNPLGFCRSAYRAVGVPDIRDYSLGFRLCCSAPRT